MRKSNTWWRSLIVSVGVIPLVIACGSDGPDEAEDPGAATDGGGGSDEPTAMRIAATGVDSLPFMAILQVAEANGFFEEEGLDVSFLSGSGGGNTLRLLATGDADIAIAGGPAVILAALQETDTQIIGSWFPINDFSWIGPEAVDGLDGLNLGATGAGSTTQLVCNYLRIQSGAEGIECTELGGGMGDSWAAARSGNLDGGWAMEPFITDKVTNEGAQVVVQSRDIIGDFPADLVAADTTYAADNPEALEAFFRASERVFAYLIDDTDAAAEDLSPILGTDPEIIAEGLRNTPEFETAYSLQVLPETLETLSDMMLEAGELDEPLDWSEVLDQSYLPEEYRAEL